MRRVRDCHLPDPFQTWIDRGKPLPTCVSVLPRTIDVSLDVWRLVYIGSSFLVMGGIVSVLLKPDLHEPDISGITFFVVCCVILLGVPLWMDCRLWRTIGASRDQKAGTLRLGVLVGPEGVLVRIWPNRCYPIPMEQFVAAKEWSGGGDTGTDWLTIETRDGPVDFAAEYLSVGAVEVNKAVAAARSSPNR